MSGNGFSRAALIGSASLFAIGLAAAAPAAAQDATPLAQATATPAEAPAATTTAQPGDQPSADEIVVTGFRASLGSALNAKRTENSAIDVIKAEDIADFPDANLAESLQRVPGVSINRVGGEGRSITVRGLSGSFTRVRVNGMEAQAISGATTSDRGINTGRGFDFNIFASELFNTLSVRKTADAETIEGSLGATVDLSVARPFDYKDFTLAVSGQAGYSTLSKNVTPKLSGLISNTFETGAGQVGFLLSAAYSKRKYFEDQFGSGGWNPVSTVDGGLCTPVGTVPVAPAINATTAANGTSATNCATGVPRQPAGDPVTALFNRPNVFLPRLPRYGRFAHDQDRLGITGSLQWAPDDRTELGVDVLYSKLDAKREESWLEGFSFARGIAAPNFGKPETAVRSGTLRDAGPASTTGVNNSFQPGSTVFDVANAVFEGVDVRSDTQHDEFTSQFSQYTLHGKIDLTDRLTVNGLLGYAKTNFDQNIQTTIMYQRPNAGMTIDFRDDLNQPTITHNFNVADASLYTFAPGNAEVRLTPSYVDNQNSVAEFNAIFAASDAFKVKVGGHFDRFKFHIQAYNRPNNFLVPTLTTAQLQAFTRTITGFGDGLRDGVFPTSWSTIDYGKFVNAYNIYSDAAGTATTTDFQIVQNLSANRTVREKITSAYAQLDFNLSEFGVPIRGNAGLRYARTSLASTGYSGAQAAFVTANVHYEDWLPSVNLVADLSDNLLLRASAAKAITRPELGFLNPAATINTGGTPSVSGGNPSLDPIRANTVDASLEWYFAKNSLVSGALFYKDIKTYIQNQSRSSNFIDTGLPPELLNNTGLSPTATVFVVNQVLNTPGGPLKGFEVNYQQGFTFLPSFLANTGALFNYTHVKSTITYFLPASTPTNLVTTKKDLLGLSRDAYNATLYYEDSKLSARVSAAYRGPYIIALPANNPSQDLEGVDKTLIFDLSASYKINDHLKITLEGLNVFDRFYRQFIDSGRDSTFVYSHTGPQYYLGIQYRF